MASHSTLTRQKGNEGEDIITELPESLISRILSPLPTKDAVRTSVLSKRWLNLWRSITKLDLNDLVFYSPKKTKIGGEEHFVNFLNFVNRALLLTKSSSLDSFSLAISYGDLYDESVINTWISTVLGRNLKKLFILLGMNFPFSYLTGHSLFNSQSLEELVMYMNYCADIKVPTNNVHMGNLKLLTLHGITFTLGSSDRLKNLSLNFPVLQKLDIIECDWLSAKCVTFNVPLLQSFYIYEGSGSRFYDPILCPIELYFSHLKEFTFCGCCISQFITFLLPSSAQNASATISLSHCVAEKDPQSELCAFMLLKQFSQVKYLKFDGPNILPQSRVAELPEFGMLCHLELGNVSGEVLLGLLHKSPVLKTLIFKGLLSKFDKEFLNSAVPDCLQNTLEVVKFEVHGHEHELYLGKFVMENGLVLKRLCFTLAAWIGKSEVIEEFKEKLYSFKKGVGFTIVEFSSE